MFLKEDGEFLQILLMDSGNRIPEALHDKIFQAFYTTKEVGEGTGLGLSISKGILDEHNASIRLVAEQSHTCFEVRMKHIAESDLKTI